MDNFKKKSALIEWVKNSLCVGQQNHDVVRVLSKNYEYLSNTQKKWFIETLEEEVNSVLNNIDLLRTNTESHLNIISYINIFKLLITNDDFLKILDYTRSIDLFKSIVGVINYRRDLSAIQIPISLFIIFHLESKRKNGNLNGHDSKY